MYIWEASLDNRYDCKVERIDEYGGRLTVVDTETKNLMLDENVSLMYGARFGPDMSDVAHWEEMIIEVIDKPIEG